MTQKLQANGKRLFAFLLAAMIALGTVITNQLPVYAADGTLTFNSGETISYGDYFTTRMTFDGSNTAYCVEPLKKTPTAGSYEYNLLANDSPVRKALYYLPGGYAYDGSIKNQYLSGWADEDAYVIGHLVVAYLYSGENADSGAFYGAPQNYIDKAVEVTNAIKGLPAPPKSFRAFIVPKNEDQTIVGSWYQKPYGHIELQKSSANTDITDGNPGYSLEGAQYDIYNGDKLVETLTTDKNGYAKSKDLEADINYTVREKNASPGFIVDVNRYNVQVKSDTASTLKVKETPQNNPMDLLLQKLDKETKEALSQGGASLQGAEFTVKFYAEQSDTDPAADGVKPVRTWVFRTDAEGKILFTKDYLVSGDSFYYQADGKTSCIPIGTVTVQETTAPEGYFAAETVFVQKITGGGKQETLSVYNAPNVEEQVYRGGVKIQKRDLETLKAEAQGSATLENAEFTITTLNEHPVLVDGKTYTKDQAVATLKTNSSGIASTEKDTLPYGHYRVDETAPPQEGYLNEGRVSIEFDIVEDGKFVELTTEENSILNQVIRGDLEFVKVSDGDLNRLANVPFSITSKTTGESHTLVTDKNGYASTSSEWNKHTANTNRGESSEDGIWFGSSAPDDSKGALIYDTYIIEEQKCKSNEGMNLLKFETTVYKNNVAIDLGTLTDDQISIATTALSQETGSHMSQPKDNITLVDTVEYEGLKKGTEYRLVGTLMDQETGEALLMDDKPVTAETTFKAKKSSGSAVVEFTFDASSLKGRTIVVFEELYQEDLKLAVHADLEDADQTIYFPEIGTSAKDSDTRTSLSHADKEVTLVDTVTYKNLVPNKKYEITGTLMDKESEKEVEIDGKPVTAKASFTPKEKNGAVDVTFAFDGTSLAGKTVVVFESLTYKDKEVAVHADINDAGQTIFFPEIGTTAKDSETGGHYACPDKEVTITDTVAYKNLIPNKEYQLTGTLMDKESGKAQEADKKPVTDTITFTPKEASGSVELTFTFDGSALAGKTVVAFESVTYEEKEVASHTDIEDEAQSIFFPEISTTAKDADDDDQQVLANEKATIIDTIAYKNLIPDTKYKVSGILMDKESKKEVLVNGKTVTAEAEFTAEKADGTVEVTFTFNASALAGHDVVVFEKLFAEGDKEIEIASHEDLKDEGQTIKLVEVPKEETPKETPDVSAPVKTGDTTAILPYVCLAGAALLVAAGLGVLYWKKRRNPKDK